MRKMVVGPIIIVIICISVVIDAPLTATNASPTPYHGDVPIVWWKENPPEFWGVFVGVHDGVDATEPAWGAHDNAREMKNTLNALDTAWKGKKLYVADPQGGGNSTWANIKNGIKWLYDSADDCDVVVFYFSGHGSNTTADANNDETDGKDESIFVGTQQSGYQLVTDDDLYKEFERFEKKPMVGLILIFDSCHSGGLVDGVKDLQNIKNPHTILMSSGEDQPSLTVKKGQFWGELPATYWGGIFTYHLLEGLGLIEYGPPLYIWTTLADANCDQITTGEELFDYAGPRTEEFMRVHELEQTPQKKNKACYKWPCGNVTVGGIIEFPQLEEPETAIPNSSGHNRDASASITAGAIAGAAVLIGAAWYIRRRRTKAIS